jgi:hypothetical protein
MFVVAVAGARSHRDAGRQIGTAARAHIATAFERDKGLPAISAFVNGDGAAIFKAILESHELAYPHLMQELRGLAEGADQPFELVAATNFVQELSLYVKAPTSCSGAVGCTDFHACFDRDGLAVSAWGHTEDGGLWAAGGYIVQCSIDYGDVPSAPAPSAYTAFCYPGCLAGWAWGFNKHGICQSINALTSKPLAAGLGASFVSRDVLDAVSLADAVARASVRAGGQHFNLACSASQQPSAHVSVEVTQCSV